MILTQTISDFVLAFIDKVRRYDWDKDTKQYVILETPHDGIHSVFSGLNTILRKKFGEGLDREELEKFPVQISDEMVAKGLIRKWSVKGGVMLFPVTDASKPVISKKTPAKLQKVLDLLDE